MDALSDMVRGVRAHGSVFASSTLAPPWSLQFPSAGPLTLCAVLEGEGWVLVDGQRPERVGPGEIVLVRPAFSFVDRVGTTAQPLVCDETCLLPEWGGTLHRRGWRDAPREDPPPPGATTLIVGAYTTDGEIGSRLLQALPAVVRLPGGGSTEAVLRHLAEEVAQDSPGQQVVLDRLLDWMLVCGLREWFELPGSRPPSWWAAQRDPVVGEALRHLHDDPAAPWTVASLAERVGVARATLAKRFTAVVGEPPLGYLTRWRMTLAADLLVRHPELGLAAVARRVGYADPFGFSAAFKRVQGLNPTQWRARPPGASAGELRAGG
ncbi:AraC family transcriptional regulator [Blastococcus sp. SYSU D00695]